MDITVLAIFIVVCQNSWPTVFLLIPLIWLNIWYRGYYLASSRELTRLNSITKAPVIHHFSESISGVMTIHSCRMQNMFSKKMLNGLMLIYVWISTTMGPMSGLVSAWRCLGLFLHGAENVGLTLSYGLPLNGVLFWYRLRGYQKQPHGYMSCFV
ncbi:unnamed protein product [Prunus armeniaca]